VRQTKQKPKPHDFLLEQVQKTELGDVDNCEKFESGSAVELEKAGFKKVFERKPVKNWHTFADQTLSSKTKSVIVPGFEYYLQLQLNSAGHHVTVQLRRNEDGGRVEGRLLQAWIKEEGQKKGYTAREFVSGDTSDSTSQIQHHIPFGWLPYESPEDLLEPAPHGLHNHPSLHGFFSDLRQLQKMLTYLAKMHLKYSPEAPKPRKKTSIQKWTKKLIDGSEIAGLTMQPGSPEHMENVREMMRSKNMPEHAVVLTGVKPVQLFDFPLDYLEEVWAITQRWFHALAAGDIFVKALHWFGEDTAHTATLWRAPVEKRKDEL